ncbi:MAG TPA: YadA-like family protein, partial [Hyphomonadaceae bacterium]|nr:YadA-like family protein [Hyphomonadaceae bacterium]
IGGIDQRVTTLETNFGLMQQDIDFLNDGYNFLQGRVDEQAKKIDENTEGVALALSMAGGGSSLMPGETFAVSMDLGTYGGKQAVSASGAMRLGSQLQLSAGAGFGIDSGTFGARAGIRFGW